MSAEAWVRELWKGGHGALGAGARAALTPFELLFRGVTALRAAGFATGLLRAHDPPIPVISVGNLSVGGTGKTPISSWVLRCLAEGGVDPALVSRGYGLDEIELHRLWTPEIPIEVDPDRVAAVRRAAQAGATIAVVDDGFQHRRLARDLDVVLLSAEQGWPGARLPRGPFREGSAALNRAGVVIVTRKSATAAESEELERRVATTAPASIRARVHLCPDRFARLDGTPVDAPVSARILTSVALPDTVGASVRQLGVEVRGMSAFPDHHDFTEAEVHAVLGESDGPVIVTEKDAVKLRALGAVAGHDVRVLGQRVVFESGETEVRGAILRAARARMGAP